MKMNNFPQNAVRISGKPPTKAYNMAILDDDSAEINMYGDVVSEWPTDWWTGKKLEGLYIAVDEFLNDLESIKDKSKITVHINSGGGDLYAGLAIYNRLKSLKGHVTTINDGMAASAASLIFQAGNTRKMNAGSTFMAHGVSGLLWGYYNVEDLKEMITEFKAHNKAVVNVYAEAMGVSYDEAKGFIEGETWLVGQEAVDKGLADEVIDDAEGSGTDNSFINRLAGKARHAHMAQFPGMLTLQNTATPAAVPPIANTKTDDSIITGGNDDMDIKNVADLRAAFPEFVAQIEDAAKQDAQNTGAQEERERIKGIEAIENTIADKNLIQNAKYGEKPLTAEQLALQALQAQAAIGTNMLNNLDDDANDSGAEDVTATPNAGAEDVQEKSVEEEVEAVANFFKKMIGGRK